MKPAAQRLWLVTALVAVTALVYADVRHFPFINWDDGEYVFANPHVLSGLSSQTLAWAWTSHVADNWHPLTMLSHSLDVEWFGMDAGWHHISSLVLHSVNTALVFLIMMRATSAAGASLFVAAIFGLHPLHVESVAWVSERKDVLSTLFVLGSILSYLRYSHQPSALQYAATLLLFVLALLSKPMVVTMPVLLLLLDYWPLRRWGHAAQARRWQELLLEKLPFVLASVALGLVTLGAQSSSVAGLDALDLETRIMNAGVGYLGYLQHTFWPVGLSAFYPMRPIPPTTGIMAVLAVIGLAGVTLWQAPRRPYLFVGVWWFLIALAPVIGIVQTGEQARADRYMYVPLIGISTACAWGAREVIARWPVSRTPILAAAALAIVGSAFLTSQQVQHWSSSEALWTAAIRASSPNYRAEEKLGEALREQGRFDDAVARYSNAIRFAPPSSPRYEAMMRNNLGIVEGRRNNHTAAAEHFALAVALTPDFSEARSNLGAALSTLGRPAEALPHLEAAARLTPESVEVHVVLGGALAALRRHEEAAAAFARAIALDPKHASARANRGVQLAQVNRMPEAIAELQLAIREDPRQPAWHYALGVIFLNAGQVDHARTQMTLALRIDPGYSAARSVLESLK